MKTPAGIVEIYAVQISSAASSIREIVSAFETMPEILVSIGI